MGSPACYAYYKKEMLGSTHEKMAIQESTLGGDKFSPHNVECKKGEG